MCAQKKVSSQVHLIKVICKYTSALNETGRSYIESAIFTVLQISVSNLNRVVID